MGLDIWFTLKKEGPEEDEERTELAYYRKVNFLVSYFEGEGLDVETQEPFEVDRYMIERLIHSCEEVLKEHKEPKDIYLILSALYDDNIDDFSLEYSEVEKIKDLAEELADSPEEFKQRFKKILENNYIILEDLPEFTTDLVNTIYDRCMETLYNGCYAEEILPTCAGFFFGSTDYDEDYFTSVEDVLNDCESVILPAFDDLEEDEKIFFEIWY